ncbi:MAG: AarF/ABC1/UbiB kinase family protein [Flavobacteriaceae bacterium]|nr:AarF/ABC1/UbiB kinase family protein [Flavobacteriaceae bacterium]
MLTRYGFENIIDRSNFKKWKLRHKTPVNKPKDIEAVSVYQRIRLALEELGPTYIKLGQLFSDRDDLLPIELVQELKKLQDNTTEEKINVVERVSKELGINPNDYFEFIDEKPLATASISQVYKAQLKNGETVVLKIKKENIQEIIEADLLIMKDLVEFLEKYNEKIKKINFSKILETFEISIHNELSFNNEYNNIERFRRNFSESEVNYVHKTYKEFSNNNMLCLEYIDGIKVTDIPRLKAEGFNTKSVALTGFDLYMQQVLEHGFFHADPHPGNIFVTLDGKISFIDFGTMGILTPFDKELLEDFVQYLIQKDAEKLINTLQKIAINYSINNEKKLQRDIYDIFELVDMSSLQSIDIKLIIKKLKLIFQENEVELPDYMYLLMKGIVLIEGIGRQLDPDINIYQIMKPYAVEIIEKKASFRYNILKRLSTVKEATEVLSSLPNDLKSLINKVKNNELTIVHEVKGITLIKNAIDRLVLAIIISALSIGSAILVMANMPPKVYGVPVLGFMGFAISGFLGVKIIVAMLKK